MIYTTRTPRRGVMTLHSGVYNFSNSSADELGLPSWKATVQKAIHSKRILLKFQSLEGLNHQDINQGLISHLEYFS